jgi:hypothetical protein
LRIAPALPSQKSGHIGQRTRATRANLADAERVMRQVAGIHVPGDGLDIDVERRGDLPHVEEGFPLERKAHFLR